MNPGSEAAVQAHEQAEIPVAVLDDELVDMVNLSEQDTGISGVIYISTAQGSHGARVKWYPARPGRDAPCLAVTIEAIPRSFNQNLPPRVASAAAVPVTRWVADNHRALLEFWNDGVSWTRAEVNAFIERLVRAG
jgi:hypothetical protein